MFFLTQPQTSIENLWSIRKTKEADLCLSPGVTFSLYFCTLLMLLCISTSPEWAMDLPLTRAGRNPTDEPRSLSPLFIKEKQRCANYTDPNSWPLMARPSSPPFCSFFPTLSFRAVLFVLVSCSWKRKSPSFRPPSRSDTHWVAMETLSGPQREASPDRAQCKWGIDGEGETGRCWKWAQGRNSCHNFVKTNPRITPLALLDISKRESKSRCIEINNAWASFWKND